jgi:hypothetical protein
LEFSSLTHKKTNKQRTNKVDCAIMKRKENNKEKRKKNTIINIKRNKRKLL